MVPGEALVEVEVAGMAVVPVQVVVAVLVVMVVAFEQPGC